MEEKGAKIAVIVGSPNKESRLNGLVWYVAEKLSAAENVEFQRIHTADLPPADLVFARFDSPDVRGANRKVEEADAVVVASPVYKASYSGVLKAYLDLLPQKALEGKIVLPLMIGGTISHLLAAEYALKPVLSALGARHILGGVFAVDTWVTKSGQDRYELTGELRQRLDDSAAQLLQELSLRVQSLHKPVYIGVKS